MSEKNPQTKVRDRAVNRTVGTTRKTVRWRLYRLRLRNHRRKPLCPSRSRRMDGNPGRLRWKFVSHHQRVRISRRRKRTKIADVKRSIRIRALRMRFTMARNPNQVSLSRLKHANGVALLCRKKNVISSVVPRNLNDHPTPLPWKRHRFLQESTSAMKRPNAYPA
uniref:Uncharacterized protein n=1 Tax=Cacopsylla melanoneura TaxID=428564 RepID=A0A8D9ADN0_9HEMI